MDANDSKNIPFVVWSHLLWDLIQQITSCLWCAFTGANYFNSGQSGVAPAFQVSTGDSLAARQVIHSRKVYMHSKYLTASQTPPPCLVIRWSVWVMFGPFLGPFLSHFGACLDHFLVMLGLGGPSWGPLANFGAILGSTSDFDVIFDQIRENGY